MLGSHTTHVLLHPVLVGLHQITYGHMSIFHAHYCVRTINLDAAYY